MRTPTTFTAVVGSLCLKSTAGFASVGTSLSIKVREPLFTLSMRPVHEDGSDAVSRRNILEKAALCAGAVGEDWYLFELDSMYLPMYTCDSEESLRVR